MDGHDGHCGLMSIKGKNEISAGMLVGMCGTAMCASHPSTATRRRSQSVDISSFSSILSLRHAQLPTLT